MKRKFTEPRNTWKFSCSVFGVDNSAACVHTRLCKLLESNWMMEDGLGGDLGSPFLSEGRVAPLSVALSIILHRVSRCGMKICAEREFDALFDSFSALMKIPRILSLIGRGEDKNLTKRFYFLRYFFSSKISIQISTRFQFANRKICVYLVIRCAEDTREK